MKFCKDCYHCYKNSINIGASYWKCRAIDNGCNPVTGTYYYFYCEEMRASLECGIDAKLFQSKPKN